MVFTLANMQTSILGKLAAANGSRPGEDGRKKPHKQAF